MYQTAEDATAVYARPSGRLGTGRGDQPTLPTNKEYLLLV